MESLDELRAERKSLILAMEKLNADYQNMVSEAEKSDLLFNAIEYKLKLNEVEQMMTELPSGQLKSH